MSGWAMAEFLNRLNQNRSSSLRPFLLQNSERVKNHAIAMAKQHGRPFQYLIQHRQGRGGATTGQARWNPARAGLYLLHSGTLPHFLVCVQQAGPGSAAVRSIGEAKMFTPLFLLHGPSFRLNPCPRSNLVSHADPNLLEWP